MKKLICVIIILLIIFIGIFYYKNIEKKTENVSMQEVEKIENYIDQIYLEKEILGEPIVYFNDISEADEKWIWQVVQKNIEDDKISYEQINQKAKEIFGEDLKK